MTIYNLAENDSYSSVEVLLHAKSTGGKLPKSRMPAKPRVRLQKSQRRSPHVKSKPLTEEEMALYDYLSTLPDLDSDIISTSSTTDATDTNNVKDVNIELAKMGHFNPEEPYTIIYNSSTILYDYSHMMEEYNIENTSYISSETEDESYSDEDMEELWNAYEKFCWMCD
jgi:hypothetical protein